MMKKLLLLPAALLAFSTLMAQEVESTNVKVGDNTTVSGYSVVIEKNIDLVEDAMKQRLNDTKLKTKKSDGFVVALNQTFSEIGSETINFYVKLEKKSKTSSTVTVCAIPVDLSVSGEDIQKNTKTFLEGFVQYVGKYEARNNMEMEQGNLKKAQKGFAAAVAAVEKLDKNIQKNTDKIAAKRSDIEKYKAKIKECEDDIKDLEKEIAKDQKKKVDAQKDVEEAQGKVKAVEGEVEKHRLLSE